MSWGTRGDRAVGLRLAQLRTQVRLTQQELADRAGVTRVTIWRWETGRHKLTLEGFVHLVQAMHLDPGTVLTQLLRAENL